MDLSSRHLAFRLVLPYISRFRTLQSALWLKLSKRAIKNLSIRTNVEKHQPRARVKINERSSRKFISGSPDASLDTIKATVSIDASFNTRETRSGLLGPQRSPWKRHLHLEIISTSERPSACRGEIK